MRLSIVFVLLNNLLGQVIPPWHHDDLCLHVQINVRGRIICLALGSAPADGLVENIYER
jgi:hypothetical protein